MDISTREIEDIVKQVVFAMQSKGAAAGNAKESQATPASYNAVPQGAAYGRDGVFENVEDAIEAAYRAQRTWAFDYRTEDRKIVVEAVRVAARKHVEEWSRKIVEETGMGRYEDKVEKHLATINKTPGPECLDTTAISGDNGLMLEEYAPFGVIAAITPTTNPTETIINNTISIISGGNSVVFNVHPRAKKVSAECLSVLHRAIVDAGGPENLITMTREPTMDNVTKLSESPKIRMMAGTGGMGMVNALLKSGKKCIGAGAGNPPVIVDETADIELASAKIYEGASFDNNLLCFAEKEAFVVDAVYDAFIYGIQKAGAYLMSPEETARVTSMCITKGKDGKLDANKDYVGKDAAVILKSAGISIPSSCRLAVCEVDNSHPFVSVEQLMPILPIVRCRDFKQAEEYALAAEQGNRHTASIFSRDVYNMTDFARIIETTIYVKNSATKAGLGIGGEGHCTMTIAGPTGEGITNAKSFCRKRRCMLAEGGLRIV